MKTLAVVFLAFLLAVSAAKTKAPVATEGTTATTLRAQSTVAVTNPPAAATTVGVSTAKPTQAATNAPTNPPAPTTTVAPIQASTVQPQGTTQRPKPTPVPTTKAPAPATSPAPAGLDFGCTCEPSKVWNDVMFVFDNSASTGQTDLTDMQYTFQSLADAYTIANMQYTENQVMRAGIITYASNATVEYALGTTTSAQLSNSSLFSLKVLPNDHGTNLKDAIKLASQQLSGPNQRESSKKVIVVFATTFNPVGDNSPIIIADEFKNGGGIIVTYDYVPTGGEDSTLRKIASPGYAISSSQVDSYDQLLNSQCDANCYCPNNYEPYINNNTRSTPAGGCYWPVTAPANAVLAANRCQMFNNGELVKVESQEKNTFVSKLFYPPRSYYIGAKLDVQNGWFWGDNKPLAYSNWCSLSPPNDPSLQCAYSVAGQNFCWQATSCRNAYNYVCEAAPCDSTHYCASA